MMTSSKKYLETTPPPFIVNLYEQIKNLDEKDQEKYLSNGNTVRVLYPDSGKI